MAKNPKPDAAEDDEPKEFVVLSPIRIGDETIVPGTDDKPVTIALDEKIAKPLLACGAIAPVKVALEADGKTQE